MTDNVASKIYHQCRILTRNLRAKGINNVNASMGLTALVNKVLDINQENTPVLTGIRFDTEINCTTMGTYSVGDTINITGTLSAYRDDISQSNIDLNGYLQNATVEIYNGVDLIGTCTTNSNGVYNYNYTPNQGGTLDLLILFNGNTDYENCNTSKTITVAPFKDILLTSNKNILSKVDNEYATLTAQLVGNNDTPLPVSGETVTFSRVICDLDESGTGILNKSIGDNYSFISDGIVSIGDSSNYIVFDYERGQYDCYGDYGGVIGDPLNEGDVISLEDGYLCFNGIARYDISDFPLLDFTNLYAYDTSGSSSSLLIEEVFAESITDSSGVATATYYSKGAGDLYIKASCGLLIQTYEMSDRLYYDTASTDKSSNYIAKQLGTKLISNTINYNNSEYTVISGVDPSAWTGVNPSVKLSTNDNWVFSAKVKSKAFPSIGLGDGIQKHIEHIRYPLAGNWAVYGYISPNQYLVSNRSLTSTSTDYYIHEISLINGTLTFKIYNDNGTLLDSATAQLPSVYENSEVYPVISTFPNTSDQRSITFKDVSIKPLTYDMNDIYYTGDWSEIINDTDNWTKYTGVTGRNIYSWLNNFTDDIEIKWKFKDNIPANWVIGLGVYTSSLNQIKGIFFNNNNNMQIWWSQSSSANQNTTISNTITTNTVFKIIINNLHRINFYIDDVLIATKDTRSDYPVYLRIDDFTSTPMELEYFKIRKL